MSPLTILAPTDAQLALMSAETYRVRSWGPLHHRWWDTQPRQRSGMVEETWKLGPFQLTRHYVREDKRYGDWHFGVLLAWRDWLGPWFTLGFGNGAQDWDRDDEWWKPGEDG